MGQLDIESGTGQTGESKKDFNESCVEEANDKPKIETSLEPITPDSHKENGDFPLDLSSPLTVVKKIPKVLTFDSNTSPNQDSVACIDNAGSPKTPKEGVFDPFAPGPEDKAWAPQCKKYSDEARGSVARRLNFSDSFKGLGSTIFDDDVEFISDEQVFESVYENLLEAIVSTQAENALAEMPIMEWDSDACRTPPSAPRLTGIADTCPGAPLKPTRPGAPVKPAGKSWTIDSKFCRKLEF